MKQRRCLEKEEAGLPLLGFLLERLDEGGALHGLGADDVVVEQQLNLVHCREDERSALTVRQHRELDRRPFRLHLRQRLYSHTPDFKHWSKGVVLSPHLISSHLNSTELFSSF